MRAVFSLPSNIKYLPCRGLLRTMEVRLFLAFICTKKKDTSIFTGKLVPGPLEIAKHGEGLQSSVNHGNAKL
jgi:hypothetical protein